jgi:hypothetical protein
MKKLQPFLILTICFSCSWVACNTATAEKYFDVTVLNSNMVVGFAGSGMARELDQPSAKLVAGTTDQTAPMKRAEVVDDKIKFTEECYEKIKDLGETGDTRDMIRASAALYEYILPVYKTEYKQLAKMYDDGAPAITIESFSTTLQEKYGPRFKELYDKLIAIGKPYAAKHNIKVNWAD